MLMGQDRYDLAEESARRALMQEPDSAIARSLLANCFMHTDRLKEATMMAQEAIGLARKLARLLPAPQAAEVLVALPDPLQQVDREQRALRKDRLELRAAAHSVGLGRRT